MTELILDERYASIYEYLDDSEEADKMLEEYGSDEDFIQQDIAKKYPDKEFFTLVDYMQEEDYFWVRVWRLK